METLFFIGFVIFAVLSLILLVITIYEYRELKKYNEDFELLTNALSEVVSVVNKNADSSKSETAIIREHSLEIAMIKELLNSHSKILSYTFPSKQWEEVVAAFRNMEET